MLSRLQSGLFRTTFHKRNYIMLHQFCPVVAKEFGVNTSIFLQNMAYWTHTNLANTRNIHDGYCWTYNTLGAFTELFPYFTKKIVRNIIDKAIKDGLIIKGNYNQTKYDRTVWYALTPKAYLYFNQLVNPKYLNLLGEAFKAICPTGHIDMFERAHRYVEKGTTIPDIKPDNKTNTTSVSSETPEVVTEVLDVYHEVMYDMPKVKHVTNKLSAAIKRLKKEWPDIKGTPLTPETLAKYFKGIRDLAPWMTKPYTTKSGYKKRNSLINLIRIDNIKSFYNGDYCAE